MNCREIIDFLEANVGPDSADGGREFRASVHLRGGVFLPCVVFRGLSEQVSLLGGRFDDKIRASVGAKDAFSQILAFTLGRNAVKSSCIVKIERSRNAMPREILAQIRGETLMSFTGFVLRMGDGRPFSFGTAFDFRFFELPDGYGFGDVAEVVNHSYVDKDGAIQTYRNHSLRDLDGVKIFHDMDYFTCYMEEI